MSKGFEILKKFKNLQILDLTENPIDSIDSIKCLKDLENLKSLQIDQFGEGEGESDESTEEFRKLLFNEFKMVKFLNGIDADGNEEFESSQDDDDFEEDSQDESNDDSDTRLEVLLGKDLSDEDEDIDFQVNESDLKDIDPTNSLIDDSDEFDDESKPSSSSTAANVSIDQIQDKSTEKRSISDVKNLKSPIKKPKV